MKLKKLNEKTNAFITLKEEIEEAELYFSIKDNICTKDMRTTAGSKMLYNYHPPFDATVVERIRGKGEILGKTSMDSWGFGTFGTNCDFGIPRNPWDLGRSPGGSSSGAAIVASALKERNVALAESTGGSISCPASFCNVFGLTPTYGLVSRWGLISYADSLDKIGLMARDLKDIALVMNYIAGGDERDPTSYQGRVPDYTKCFGEIKGLKVGVPREYFEHVEEEVKEKVMDGISLLDSLGAEIREVSLKLTKYALASYYLIALSEASTNLARFCGLRYGLSAEMEGEFNEYFSKVRGSGFNQESKRRIILGTFARMAGYRGRYYLKALKVRRLIINEFKEVFSKCDLIAAPTMPILPPKFEEIEELKPIQVYAMDQLTVGPNLAGIPMLSVPIGFSRGLPVGLHLMADHFREDLLFRVGRAIQEHTNYWRKVPEL